MNKRKSFSLKASMSLCAAMLLFSCEVEPLREAPAGDDYFPLQAGTSWEYREEFFSTYLQDGEPESWGSSRFVIFAEKDTVVDGKAYLKLADTHLLYVRLLRKEGSSYYMREIDYGNRLSEEVLFLDSSKAAGDSWTQEAKTGWGADRKIRFEVKSVRKEAVIEGRVYQDVIEVEEHHYYRDLSGEGSPAYIITHRYAKGLGEVWSYYPYPSRNYANTRLSLTQYRYK